MLSLTISKDSYEMNMHNERSMFEMVNLDECWSAWGYETAQKKSILEHHLKDHPNDHDSFNISVFFGRIHFRCQKFLLRNAELFRTWELEVYNFERKHQITPTAFAFFYNFALGKQPTIPAKLILSALQTSEILNASDFNVYCKRKLDSSLYIEDAAFEILMIAKDEKFLNVERIMIHRIWKYFLPFVGTKHFIEMGIEDVCNFLNSNTIGVNSEIEVFYAAILWLNMKWKDRKEQYIEKVMKCVRYALIPPWFIYYLKKKTGTLEVDRVIQHKTVSKLISDAASISATISLYILDQSKFQIILQRIFPKIPKQRSWIYDKNCTYHYGAHEKVTEAINYGLFKDYLKMMQMEGVDYWHNIHEAHDNHFAQIFSQKFSDSALSKIQF